MVAWMKKLSEVIQKRSDKSKYDFSVSVNRNRTEMAEQYLHGILIGSTLSVEKIDRKSLFILGHIIGINELAGYDCRTCGKPWYKISYDGIYYSGEYHVPVCECQFRCPVCGSVLYEEFYRGDLRHDKYHCPMCSYALLQPQADSNSTSMVSCWRKADLHGIVKAEVEAQKIRFLYHKYSKEVITAIEEKAGMKAIDFKMVNGMIVKPETGLFKVKFQESKMGKWKGEER